MLLLLIWKMFSIELDGLFGVDSGGRTSSSSCSVTLVCSVVPVVATVATVVVVVVVTFGVGVVAVEGFDHFGPPNRMVDGE